GAAVSVGNYLAPTMLERAGPVIATLGRALAGGRLLETLAREGAVGTAAVAGLVVREAGASLAASLTRLAVVVAQRPAAKAIVRRALSVDEALLRSAAALLRHDADAVFLGAAPVLPALGRRLLARDHADVHLAGAGGRAHEEV